MKTVITIPKSLNDIKIQLVSKTLDYTKGDRLKACLLLGISIKTLNKYRKLGEKKYDKSK